LGSLQGRSRTEQLREFLSRSKKQVLVAMKEATLGRGFDAILTNEFYTLASDGAEGVRRGAVLVWLQFGRAELYFDHFAIAENSLNQFLGIRDAGSGNFQALHHMAVLFLKRALSIENLALAEADIKRGEEILLSQIRERGHLDTYPYEGLVSHKLKWLLRKQGPHMREEMEARHNRAGRTQPASLRRPDARRVPEGVSRLSYAGGPAPKLKKT
jgi:hypothetical protein